MCFPRSRFARAAHCAHSRASTLTPHLAGAAADVVERQSNIALAAVRGLYDRDRPAGWDGLPVSNPAIRPQWLTRSRPAIEQDEAGASL